MTELSDAEKLAAATSAHSARIDGPMMHKKQNHANVHSLQ